MSWPAPDWDRKIPPNVALRGGPWDGKVVPLRGLYCVGPSAIFENGYTCCVGVYDWAYEVVGPNQRRWFGKWRPACV